MAHQPPKRGHERQQKRAVPCLDSSRSHLSPDWFCFSAGLGNFSSSSLLLTRSCVVIALRFCSGSLPVRAPPKLNDARRIIELEGRTHPFGGEASFQRDRLGGAVTSPTITGVRTTRPT